LFLGSRVWRIELRAGKEHLMRWGIRRWSDLDTKIGDMFQAMLAAIRYAVPNGDSNRSRWANHLLWDLVVREVVGDLPDMTSGADPQRIKKVRRDHLQETLLKQIIGNAATLSVAGGFQDHELDTLPDSVAGTLDRFMREQRERFDEKRARAAERYDFIERPVPRNRWVQQELMRAWSKTIALRYLQVRQFHFVPIAQVVGNFENNAFLANVRRYITVVKQGDPYFASADGVTVFSAAGHYMLASIHGGILGAHEHDGTKNFSSPVRLGQSHLEKANSVINTAKNLEVTRYLRKFTPIRLNSKMGKAAVIVGHKVNRSSVSLTKPQEAPEHVQEDRAEPKPNPIAPVCH
jgi:hypothetical protein